MINLDPQQRDCAMGNATTPPDPALVLNENTSNKIRVMGGQKPPSARAFVHRRRGFQSQIAV